MARTQLFISYARKDNRWRLKVVSHLGLLSEIIEVWDDSAIGPGQKWISSINGAMSRARIALLLISVNFLNSDFIKKREIPELFRKHESEGMSIYPLLVDYCSWEEVGWLKELQIRPNGDKPVSDYGNRVNKILTQVAREIAAIARSTATKSRKRTQKKARAKTAPVGRPGAGKKRGVAKRAKKAPAHVSTKAPAKRPVTRERSSKKAKPK
ncbi:MAG: TIR domain-containing protein [Pyrinomonadaceae bacterium]